MPDYARLGRVAILPAIALLALSSVGYRAIVAADHNDPPARTDASIDPTPDRAADLADVYAFHDATNLVLIVTFAGPHATTLPAAYDPNVLYTIHVSTDGDPRTTEFPIDVRFGFDGSNPGVQVSGVPGIPGALVGPVETDLQRNGILVRAGLFDDPFFFDLQGLRETRQTGTLAFNNTRDFFARQNVTAVVIQMPKAELQRGNNNIDVWASTGRIGGQL